MFFLGTCVSVLVGVSHYIAEALIDLALDIHVEDC